MPASEKWLAQKRLKVLLLYCAVLFTVFFVMSWSSYHVASKVVSQRIEQNSLPLTSDNVYSQIQRDLVNPMFIASLMAHDTFVRDWALQASPPAAPIQRYLTEINSKFGTFLSFFILEKDGRYFLPDRVLQLDNMPGNGDWYRRLQALPLEQHYTVDIGHDPDNPERTDIYIDHLVYDYAGQRIGVTGVGLSVNKVRKLITEYQQKYQRTIYFVDQQGKVMLQSKNGQLQSLKQRQGIAAIYNRLFTGEETSFHFEDELGTVYLNVRLVEEFNWYLIVEERDGVSNSPMFSQFLINVGTALAVTLVVLAVGFVTQGRFHRRLAHAATVDPLTGANNRRSGELIFSAMSKDSDSWPMALMILDIDHFKQINDTYGHDTGDLVLKKLVEHCRTHVRQSDIICRWGGEEFVMLFSHCDAQKAQDLAERIRLGVEALTIITGGKRLSVTISAGMVMMEPSGSLSDWLLHADEALYQAKSQGRNQIVWWPATH
ncbi:hypothetical protein HR45_02530 [Shewanella mangrovi]|uniref:diguanylate cyclase n=1 Tax=Shewanella mangrovi TaxID=1515746 RepID=A0A094JJC6_9GAMM|nr:sensor domain-containing diguanylate cyclase [Shewanella mangrovi]KFZ39282.1 hypothetical protein HR45_02530 [Shewanella mangrovi]